MTDVTKVSDLLTQNSILALTYYVQEGCCKYIKCICLNNAVVFLLRVSSSFEMKVPENHHQISLSTIERPLIYDQSLEYEPPQNSATDPYTEMYITTDQTIHATLYSIITRLGKCFRKLNFRISLELGGIFCEMRSDFSLEWFTCDLSNKKNSINWYITIPLEQYYESQGTFNAQLYQCEQQLSAILQQGQQTHLLSITRDKLNIVVQQATQNAQTIKGLGQTIQQLKESLTKMVNREMEILGKLDELEKHRRTDPHHAVEGRIAITLSKLGQELDRTKIYILKLVEQITLRDEELKNLSLKQDEMLYKLSRALSLP